MVDDGEAGGVDADRRGIPDFDKRLTKLGDAVEIAVAGYCVEQTLRVGGESLAAHPNACPFAIGCSERCRDLICRAVEGKNPPCRARARFHDSTGGPENCLVTVDIGQNERAALFAHSAIEALAPTCTGDRGGRDNLLAGRHVEYVDEVSGTLRRAIRGVPGYEVDSVGIGVDNGCADDSPLVVYGVAIDCSLRTDAVVRLVFGPSGGAAEDRIAHGYSPEIRAGASINATDHVRHGG